MKELDEVKHAVLETAREMDRAGLTEGTAGNVSARTRAGEIVLTPTAMDYHQMSVQDLVVTDLSGKIIGGSRAPTTEFRLHLACLGKHRDIAAVVHTHAVHASMFAALNEPIPSAIEEVDLYVGGEVPVAAYHPTGSDALGVAVAALLADRGAALLANHGLVTVAATPSDALQITRIVERTAKIIWGARVMGDPIRLPESARERFGLHYRERRAASAAEANLEGGSA